MPSLDPRYPPLSTGQLRAIWKRSPTPAVRLLLWEIYRLRLVAIHAHSYTKFMTQVTGGNVDEVTYDNKTGTSDTDGPVNFQFDNGEGRAVEAWPQAVLLDTGIRRSNTCRVQCRFLWRDHDQNPFCTESHRLSAHRRRTHCYFLLGVRKKTRRYIHSSCGRHRSRAVDAGISAGDIGWHALARP